MRALLVANPAATTTTRKVRDVLVRALSSQLDVELAETAHRGHARELAARAAADGVDLVVTLGGDGTVNEAANGLLAAGPAPDGPMLAVVPGGSTNVFARALGRSRDPVEATGEILDSLRAGRTRLVSLGTAEARTGGEGTTEGWTTPRWFVFAAGMGFDADVISRVEAQRARGRRSTGSLYIGAGVNAFVLGRDRRRPPMTLQLPGAPPVDGLFLALVSNVSPWTYLGARPIDPSPEASFDTGLDLFAMGRVGVVRMLHHVRQTMAARPDARGRGVHRWHDLGELTLTSARPQGWQLDGDHLGTTTGLRVRSVPDALRVVV
ncbi:MULTISPECIES: diacylglycerol/lipid kinase family protein [unclassified Modestobacter]|uniref:diacylglycerol/lipid kinase family protein n=1 Tax=unclassified Modestobacter TaxID=2643866 RepID=UPI0022AAA8DD|nr:MULTISPECIES: diacylglycerol kinase family protein [unclassified Modestobacter]MCZ2812480.1 diacylglycerol kinase family protein [Modestobacter sp. VKM Ac-2979]MCZ2841370.1 diacylglycerol kinase family protein [Modestobacter sp. VKM Ac-2980]MCZ2850104.1 diacylglycerol kinase family protein [Modestobacter sp. VKM Ac-2978]